jgi:Flavin containing amine oxidoreductase
LNQQDAKNGLHSRRSVLRALGGGLLAACTLDGLMGTAAVAKEDLPYKIYGWTGDDFTLGHRLRDKKFEGGPRKVEKAVDFVIIGGGMSGLSLAHFLQDHDFLLLEQYSDLGGQARGNPSGQPGFSYGSTWINSVEGELGQLLDVLGLKPKKLESISTCWRWNDTWANYPKESNEPTLTKSFENLLEPCRNQLAKVGKSFAFASSNDDAAAEMDKVAFEKVADIQPGQFRNLIDNYFRSVACCNASTASSLAGFALIQSLINQRYALPGGNAVIVDALKSSLTAKHPDALLTNVFVWSVELQDNGALVTYSDATGEYHTISAKHVSITAPPMVASRLVTNIDNSTRIPLLKFRYGSYLVGNLQLRSSLLDFGYQGYSNQLSGLAEIDIAGALGTPRDLSRLTLKQPFEPGSEGRELLLDGDQPELATSLIDQLQACLPTRKLDVESITLSRWGHAIAVPLRGYYSLIGKIAANQLSSLSFSHCSTAGIASLEAAVEAARQAADRALGKQVKKAISLSY